MFLTKEQRAAEALKKRQEEVEKQRMKMEEERKSRQKYVHETDNAGSGYRRSSEHHQEERDRRRGETLDLKDREKEAEAIRVSRLCNTPLIITVASSHRSDTWVVKRNEGE